MEYREGLHTKYEIEYPLCRALYHFVWATKYRYHVLVGDVALRVRELVRQTCEQFEIRIIRGVVSKDHTRSLTVTGHFVHLLVKCPAERVSAPPTLAPEEIMRRVKGRTARKLFEEYPRLKKRYWGRHLWARGYFCVTAGELTKQMIETYLEHHFEKRNEDRFEVEE